MTTSVVGEAVFLRYSLTGFLLFWMAWQSFELNVLPAALAEHLNARKLYRLAATAGMIRTSPPS